MGQGFSSGVLAFKNAKSTDFFLPTAPHFPPATVPFNVFRTKRQEANPVQVVACGNKSGLLAESSSEKK